MIVGWGRKPNTSWGRNFATKHSIPYVGLEDGFFRSVDLGVSGAPPLSVVLDDIGIYYDAREPSRLENILAASGPSDPLEDETLLKRADDLIELVRENELSKYNNSAPRGDRESILGTKDRERILVVDQTAGDLSIAFGLASAESFKTMLESARADYPDAEIIIKTHPDVVSGKKLGHFSAADIRPGHERLLASTDNPIALLGEVDHVYAVTSQLGFEALILGLPVVCFGVPFYAGWGLTDDRGPRVTRRNRKRSRRQLFAASILLYPSYLNPENSQPGNAKDVLGHLARQRQAFAKNRGTLFAIGFSAWKHNFIRAYLACPGNTIHFVKDAHEARRRGFNTDSKLITWGSRGSDAADELMGQFGVPRWRMEDAFLRSVGLGSDLTVPASLVLDPEGIYYDPNAPSRLERILESADWTAEDVERGRMLRLQMIEARVSKYNVGKKKQLAVPDGKKVVLVVGQVEDDASIQLGCVDIKTNAALLAAARDSNPDAYIVWKPHPDVVSGNREGHVQPAIAMRFADRIEDNVALADCLDAANEVHTMTSLVGFESLLRDIDVVVYGRPFYAGWGLSRDRHQNMRRTRQVSVDELACAALIRYPRYLHPVTLRFTTAEVIADALATARDSGGSELKISWPRRQLRKLGHLVGELRRVP